MLIRDTISFQEKSLQLQRSKCHSSPATFGPLLPRGYLCCLIRSLLHSTMWRTPKHSIKSSINNNSCTEQDKRKTYRCKGQVKTIPRMENKMFLPVDCCYLLFKSSLNKMQAAATKIQKERFYTSFPTPWRCIFACGCRNSTSEVSEKRQYSQTPLLPSPLWLSLRLRTVPPDR